MFFWKLTESKLLILKKTIKWQKIAKLKLKANSKYYIQ